MNGLGTNDPYLPVNGDFRPEGLRDMLQPRQDIVRYLALRQ